MGDDSTRDPQPEPAANEVPHHEQPTHDQPVHEQPIHEQPTHDQPTHDQPIEEEVGDFITGHVLEKDTVFFEG